MATTAKGGGSEDRDISELEFSSHQTCDSSNATLH